jgi:hypothetical protein
VTSGRERARLARERETEGVLRRFYGLSTREQLEVFKTITAFMGGARVPPETAVDREVGARLESMEAMQTVAAHLGRSNGGMGRGKGARLTIAEFDAASRELDLGVSSKQVRTAWGTWQEANRVLAGGKAHDTPTQAALRRARGSWSRQTETPLAGLREWLEDAHGIGGGQPKTFLLADYDRYVRLRNHALVADPPLLSAYGVKRQLRLNWADCLACARGETDAETLRAERDRDLELQARAGRLGLISGGDVARILGIRQVTKGVQERPGFPVVVAKVGRQNLWRLDHVRQYQQEGTSPFEHPLALQNSIVQAKEVARKLDISVTELHRLLKRAREGGPQLIPEPAGNTGQMPYWLRHEVADLKPDPAITKALRRHIMRPGKRTRDYRSIWATPTQNAQYAQQQAERRRRLQDDPDDEAQ